MFRHSLSVSTETEQIPGGDYSTSSWLKILEDIIFVLLSISLSFSYIVLLKLQSCKLFSVMVNSFHNFLSTLFFGLEVTSVCPPLKESTDIRSSMCVRSTLFILSIFHISWNIEPANNTFKVLTELSIKKCNNQSNALHSTQQHPALLS